MSTFTNQEATVIRKLCSEHYDAVCKRLLENETNPITTDELVTIANDTEVVAGILKNS